MQPSSQRCCPPRCGTSGGPRIHSPALSCGSWGGGNAARGRGPDSLATVKAALGHGPETSPESLEAGAPAVSVQLKHTQALHARGCWLPLSHATLKLPTWASANSAGRSAAGRGPGKGTGRTGGRTRHGAHTFPNTTPLLCRGRAGSRSLASGSLPTGCPYTRRPRDVDPSERGRRPAVWAQPPQPAPLLLTPVATAIKVQRRLVNLIPANELPPLVNNHSGANTAPGYPSGCSAAEASPSLWC